MNLCFLIGKVKRDVTFQFFYKSKKISIAKTEIVVKNDVDITIIGYDEMADWMYQYLGKNEDVFVKGKLNSKMEVEVEWIKI